MSNDHRIVGLACLLVAVGLSGCAPAPGGVATAPRGAPVQGGERGRAVKAGDVDAGAGTLEAVRRRLEGTWALASMQAFDASGRPTPIKAGGKLVYDAYGNFDLAVQLDPSAVQALGAAGNALDLKGRAVIDVARQLLRVQDVEAAGTAPRAENVDRVRYYAFDGDALELTVKDPAGRVTISSTWKRQQ